MVQITSPSNLAVYAVGDKIPLAANASDPGGAIRAVDFYLLEGHSFLAVEQLVGTAFAPPYEFSLSGLGAGSYRVFARARDSASQATDSDQRHIAVVASGARLTIQFMPGHIMVSRPTGSILQQADTPTGRWIDVPNAPNPTMIFPQSKAQFFRAYFP